MKSKKNIKSIMLFVILSIVALLFIDTSFAANTAKVNVETANLRETADSNSKILILLPINQEVEILGKEENWYKVKVSGITGYLREDIITLDGEASQKAVETATKPAESTETPKATEATQTETTTTETEQTEKPVEATEIKEENDEKITASEEKKKVKENTKLKIIPVINATDIIEVKQGEEVTITEKINGWVCIETELTKGWIREEKLEEIEPKVEEQTPEEETKPEEGEAQQATEVVAEPEKIQKTLYVNTELVNMRKEASTSAEVIARLSLNTAVDVYDEQNGWYKVKVSGNDGYISSSLLSETKQEVTTTSRSAEAPRGSSGTSTASTARTDETTTAPTTGKGATVVETAKNYIGSKYVYGGSSPSGFDCSGFTLYIYKQHGVSLNRTAAAQFKNGASVARGDLQPGDLIMFGPSVSAINHVGIYIGGGQIVHAANSSRGVTIDTINSGYYNNTYVGARRVI